VADLGEDRGSSRDRDGHRNGGGAVVREAGLSAREKREQRIAQFTNENQLTHFFTF